MRKHCLTLFFFPHNHSLTETIVFVYMGMGVFTGGFQNWDLTFSVVALISCLVGRAVNIFPLSFIANFCRTQSNKITAKRQVVLWFAGLRGAIAFALSENMPGPHKDVYATATLTICIVTTVFCGGVTERVLTVFEMREQATPRLSYAEEDDAMDLHSLTYTPPVPQKRETRLDIRKRRIKEGIKGVWFRFDESFLKVHFGGDKKEREHHDYDREDYDRDGDSSSWSGNYEMKTRNSSPSRKARNRYEEDDDDEEMISLTASFETE